MSAAGRVVGFPVLIVSALILSACDRPFVEPDRPTVEIVSPDLSTIFPNTKLRLEVDITAERGVQRAAVNGDSLTFDPIERLWVIDYALHPGLNRLVFSVTDSDDRTTLDTVYAVHGTLNVDRNTPALPEPRGGHSATLIHLQQTLVVIGGTGSSSSDALGSAVLWDVTGSQIRHASDEMVVPRTGHTATLLPDGRILILGGSRGEPLVDILGLVETVEIFNPASGTFSRVPFAGLPIRRAFHTATLHQEGGEVFIDLYGGRGDIAFGSNAVLGIRDDLRRFQFRNDSLIARSPKIGPALNFPLWGHIQNALDDERFLIAGTDYTGGQERNIAFTVDYGSLAGIVQQETGELVQPRIRHASARITEGFIGVFGGYEESPSNPVNDAEIYSDEARRFFIFPPSSILLRRYGHTATNLPDGRILLVGGYFSAGQGSVTTSVVRVPSL